MTIKYVIVEQQRMSGRYVALRNLSFDTEQAAQNHIDTKFHERLRKSVHVESRTVKDIDASQVMHCQCCGRDIHAALGSIAHHGYTRPGDGWQTPSCFGAKRLPWEVDRSAVADLIDHLKEVLLRSEYERCAVSDEIEPVVHHYQVYDRRVRGGYVGKKLTMTRDTFEIVKAANPDKVFEHTPGITFDVFKARDLDKRDRRIEQLRRDLKEFAARYAGWKQTHKWNGKLWEAI